MKKNYFIIFFFLTLTNLTYAQKVIKMERINNTYQIPCKVNGIPMNFIFDTGASDVSISITEAKFLIKQGLLTQDDLIEKVEYQIANGDIIEGTTVNLKSIEIDNIILNNIRASIIDSQNAPLLLGQSAISKIGRYSISGDILTLLDYEPKNLTATSEKNKEINNVNVEALSFFNTFLNNKGWALESKGELRFDKYTNSLSFEGSNTVKDPITEEISFTSIQSFSIPIDDIILIEEIVHKKDPKSSNDANVIFFDIKLKNKAKHYYLKTGKGKLPEQKTEYRKKLTLRIAKFNLSELDIKNLQLAIRDILPNARFEQIKID